MRNLTLTIMLFATLASACAERTSTPSEKREPSTANVSAAATPDRPEQWLPQSVENCIASVRDGHRVEPASDFNPFYLSADFDSDGASDVAVLVRSNIDGGSRLNGLLMCMENRETGRFGGAFFAGESATSFEKDNFVTSSWETVPRGKLRSEALDRKGRPLLFGVAKGDVVAFFHEGGAVFVYWDGSRFKAVEGF